MSAYNTGRLHDAGHMADAAKAAVRGRTTQRVQAMLLARRSTPWAKPANASSPTPDWAYWFDRTGFFGARHPATGT